MQRGKAPRITLHRDDAVCSFEEQSTGEPARSRPDFEDGVAGERAGGTGDAPRQVEIEQEVLAEALLRREPVPRDDVAQGRQAIAHGRDGAWAAIAQASFTAWIRLDGLALPVPARDNAVP